MLNIPFLAAAFVLMPLSIIPLALFLFFGVEYSAPPIRAKAIPIVDSLFNVLYVMPAVVAYRVISGEFPPPLVVIAAAAWTAAMHAYSAVPDIASDREAGVATVATFLGPRGTLLFCFVLFAAAAVVSFPWLGIVSVVLGAVYLTVMVASFRSLKSDSLFSLYRDISRHQPRVGIYHFLGDISSQISMIKASRAGSPCRSYECVCTQARPRSDRSAYRCPDSFRHRCSTNS